MNNVKKIFMFLWNKKTIIIKYVFFTLCIALYFVFIQHNFNVIEQIKLGNFVKIIESDAYEWHLRSKYNFILWVYIEICVDVILLSLTLWCLYKKSKWAYWWALSPFTLGYLLMYTEKLFFN